MTRFTSSLFAIALGKRIRVALCRLLLTFVMLWSLQLGAAAKDSASEPKKTIVGKGTIHYVSLEGGFYVIKSEEGKYYDPINLAADLKQDGLLVQFELKEIRGQASIHMHGTIVEIIRMRKIK
jgi:hypothetical protein